jgi:hypothetical protein
MRCTGRKRGQHQCVRRQIPMRTAADLREAVVIVPVHCSRSVAGLGGGGPLGPRPEISSGILPGSSSGRGGSPGSRIGGGASGFGLPGGFPAAARSACPGLPAGFREVRSASTSSPCDFRRDPDPRRWLPSQTYARWPRSFLASLLAMRSKGRDPGACHGQRPSGNVGVRNARPAASGPPRS